MYSSSVTFRAAVIAVIAANRLVAWSRQESVLGKPFPLHRSTLPVPPSTPGRSRSRGRSGSAGVAFDVETPLNGNGQRGASAVTGTRWRRSFAQFLFLQPVGEGGVIEPPTLQMLAHVLGSSGSAAAASGTSLPPSRYFTTGDVDGGGLVRTGIAVLLDEKQLFDSKID